MCCLFALCFRHTTSDSWVTSPSTGEGASQADDAPILYSISFSCRSDRQLLLAACAAKACIHSWKVLSANVLKAALLCYAEGRDISQKGCRSNSWNGCSDFLRNAFPGAERSLKDFDVLQCCACLCGHGTRGHTLCHHRAS